jgi:hypothetical protein
MRSAASTSSPALVVGNFRPPGKGWSWLVNVGRMRNRERKNTLLYLDNFDKFDQRSLWTL